MYLALYRKWRPKVFGDVIAQPHITTPLKKQIASGKTAHAYLFTGPRGTGKTTCGKILAKAVNCPNAKDGDPCLECDICRGIDDASLLDVSEIDAASNNGVDNIRDLRDEAGFTPAVCKYRVYIIDEAHMLTDGAFNALLKILEEPPSHIIFILATTESNKIPATILSRCQRFDFKRISPSDIADRLMYISEQEKINLDREAALLIGKIADGGMRDALSLLDRCTAMSPQVDVKTVSSAAGLAGKEYLFKLTQCIISKDTSGSLNLMEELNSNTGDLSVLCDELISHFRNIMIAKTVTKPAELITAPQEEIEKLSAFAEKMELSRILEILSVLQELSLRIKKTPSKRLEFEMALIRLTSPDFSDKNTKTLSTTVDTGSLERLSEKVQKLESMLSSPRNNPSPVLRPQTSPAPAKVKKEKIDYSKFVPVGYFAEILDILKKDDPPLYGMLFGAKAYEYEDIILISSDKNLLANLMKNQKSAENLSNAFFKHTGKRYNFRFRKTENKDKDTDSPADSPLDSLLQAAKQAGVEVKE